MLRRSPEFPPTGEMAAEEMADAAQPDPQDRLRSKLATIAVKSVETRRLEVDSLKRLVCNLRRHEVPCLTSQHAQGRQRQQRHRESALCLKRVRAAASPRTCSAGDCNGLMAHCMGAIDMDLHRNRHAALQALTAVRQAVSQGSPPLQGTSASCLAVRRMS